MTPDEDRLTRHGLQLLRAHFRGDTALRDRLVGEGLDGAVPVGDGLQVPLADALGYAAVLGASMLAQTTQRPLQDVLTGLPPTSVRLVPEPAGVPWAEALEMVAAILRSNEAAGQASVAMDAPSAPNGLFSVAVSAWEELQRVTGRPATELLSAGLSAPPQYESPAG